MIVVAGAQVKRDGQVRAKGSPVHHATLGPLEEAGPGHVELAAGRARLDGRFVKEERERLLARVFMSFARALRAVLSAVRLGRDCYQAVTSEIAAHKTVVDRDRHRARKSKSPSSFPHAGPEDTVTRTTPAIITMANTPA